MALQKNIKTKKIALRSTLGRANNLKAMFKKIKLGVKIVRTIGFKNTFVGAKFLYKLKNSKDMTNLKDKVSNVCGFVFAIAGIILTLPTMGIVLPAVIITVATASVTVSGGVIAYLTGKQPNGTAKSSSAVEQQNHQ